MAKKKATKKATKKTPAKRNGRKSVVETLTRRATVCKLIIQGISAPQIASLLNVRVDTVYEDSQSLRENWANRLALDYDKHVAEQLARIELVERSAWEGWERSLKPKTSQERTFYALDLDEDEEVQVREVYDLKKKTEEQGGNPAFLAVLQRCIAERSKLLGLDKREDEATDVDDVPIVAVIVETREDVEHMNTMNRVLAINQIDGEVLERREG